ncbi:serine/threonine-protein kinase [Streptomyces chlorus]|uniref:Serine/threonine-protein kinase n=1 Tax=Streptomyces chlorus TaxID=887452 RepID=A0ABW1E8M1_9ACTN
MNLPARIGPYRPTRHLGTGGMGTVYYATDPDGGPLAIKVLHQDFATDPAHRARFRRETTMLRKVTGPYLVPLVDADPEAPVPWLATAYVHGNTLHQHVRDDGAMGPDNLLTFAAAVAHALACIHDTGVAHRDLKPTNVLLAADGPRVVHFGIAHHLDATATSVTTGTPGWMAPEQLTDGTTLPACDIFAWGVLVAYAAAASHPFGAPRASRTVSSVPRRRSRECPTPCSPSCERPCTRSPDGARARRRLPSGRQPCTGRRAPPSSRPWPTRGPSTALPNGLTSTPILVSPCPWTARAMERPPARRASCRGSACRRRTCK